MKKIVIGGISAAVFSLAGLAPAIANADTVDAAFVSAIRDGGIPGSLNILIENAHTVCHNIDVAGMSPLEVQRQVLRETDLDYNHSIWFTIVSIQSYCPWNQNLMPGQTDATARATTQT